MKSTKPTYDQLAEALVYLDDAFSLLFAQTASNPVSNAWGKPIDFSPVNEGRMKASSVVYNLRSCGDDRYAYPHLVGQLPPVRETAEEPKPQGNLQAYLEQEFDEYNFRDILLHDMVSQEQRRQSKNCDSIESRHVIQERIIEEFGQAYSPMELMILVGNALSRIARGETSE